MKKLLVSVLLSCLITCTFVSLVSAQLPLFTVNFDRIFYDVGSTGTVIINIQTTDQAFDIREMGLQLYLPRTDRTFFVTEFFGENYNDSPLQIPAYGNISVYVSFNIPQRSDLVSGIFYYTFEVWLREQGATTYSHHTPGQLKATSNDYNCILLSPDVTLSPGPTPTPTPIPTPTQTPIPTTTPTSTPTPTPTPIIDFFSVEVLLGIVIIIAVVIIIILVIIILVILKKKKK